MIFSVARAATLFSLVFCKRSFELPPGRYNASCVYDAEIEYLIKPMLASEKRMSEKLVGELSQRYKSRMQKLGLLKEKTEIILYIAQQRGEFLPVEMNSFVQMVHHRCLSENGDILFLPGREKSSEKVKAPTILAGVFSTKNIPDYRYKQKEPEKIYNTPEDDLKAGEDVQDGYGRLRLRKVLIIRDNFLFQLLRSIMKY